MAKSMTHLSEGTFICGTCDMSFVNEEEMTNHNNDVHDKASTAANVEETEEISSMSGTSRGYLSSYTTIFSSFHMKVTDKKNITIKLKKHQFDRVQCNFLCANYLILCHDILSGSKVSLHMGTSLTQLKVLSHKICFP